MTLKIFVVVVLILKNYKMLQSLRYRAEFNSFISDMCFGAMNLQKWEASSLSSGSILYVVYCILTEEPIMARNKAKNKQPILAFHPIKLEKKPR